jgi:hypothetical protein
MRSAPIGRLSAVAGTAALCIAVGTPLAASAGSTANPTVTSPTATAPRYEVGLFGDMPYGDFGRAQYPALLASMNRADLAFSLFDGDIKNGSEPCYANFDGSSVAAGKSDVYQYALRHSNRLEAPVVVVPGDNEWTDCDRTKIIPNFDSVRRLQYERKIFYPTNQSLGQRTMTVTRQSKDYPENVRWTAGPVTYIGLNVPGSDNNWVDPARDGTAEGPAAESHREYRARNRANLAWLSASFTAARHAHSKAVMIVLQADMWDPFAAAENALGHYADTKAALARLVIGFGKPVVLVNGDSHSFEVDKPLTDAATVNAAGDEGPNVIENFTRVTTFGEAQNHWVSATIDANDPNVFTFHQHIVAANLPTYTLPPAP